MGQVTQLFVAVGSRRPMLEVEDVMAVAHRGLDGCRHSRPGSRRQVLLVESETLEALGLGPGEVKENITTRGLPLTDLAAGQRLGVGQALLEVTGPCEPCGRMDEIRMGLQQELHGRRGILCRVVEGGRILRGDAIQVVGAAVSAPENGGDL